MILGDAVLKLETFVWILSHVLHLGYILTVSAQCNRGGTTDFMLANLCLAKLSFAISKCLLPSTYNFFDFLVRASLYF